MKVVFFGLCRLAESSFSIHKKNQLIATEGASDNIQEPFFIFQKELRKQGQER